ncbi:uncharacterized protein At4g18490 isoform X2 [Mangifera indica]|uniref:uncharacterized protein At4g18490 isoform X2 n=1 Tax=Mangifera indica TaxID=29780 RepID=UPI001CFA1A31|nr:uncharacterized protein At4g18490 isoform X2 [Mangifera indica]
MADTCDKNSAPANVKEKKSLLDEEIGKDFLTSWKSMAVTEDDAMDFSFDTVPNGKKKFNFDQLDMDFNLDGDFDKLSSFKVDMPDLDFSCPSTKNAKTKERAEDDCSTGNHQPKKDFFNFSFDFNDDDFVKDTKTRGKVVGNSKPVIGKLPDDELFWLRNEKNVKKLGSTGKELNSVQNESKLDGDLRHQGEQVTEQEPANLGSQQNMGDDLHASDVQIGSELVDISKSIVRESTEGEHGLLRSENNIKILNDVREDAESDGAQHESKIVGDLRPKDKQVAEGEPVKQGSEKSTRLQVDHFPTQYPPIWEGFTTNDDVQINDIMVVSKSLSKELKEMESVSLGSEKNVKCLSHIREVTNDDDVQHLSKVVNINPQDKQAKTGELVKPKSENYSGFHANSAGLHQNQLKLSTQASGNPKFAISSTHSIQNPKNVSVEELKTVKRTSNLSTLKNLRNIGGNKDMPNSTVLRQISLSRNPGQTVKLPGITKSTIGHLVGGIEKQNPVTPSLKRKKIEESSSDLVSLKSLKHISESPKESRKLKESLGGVTEGEIKKHENQRPNGAKNVLHGHTSPRLDVVRDVSLTKLEIQLVMENDGNVEKAEAYTKELEDICNMLKKKHEEAKEIMVRAIVNNNNLLMLNHPIYEEKIRMVQKFATELMCKEIPT